MLFIDICNSIKFWNKADRIGPDIPLTHWRLHFKSTMRQLCSNKFLKFGIDSEFRAGAYAICCSKISLGNRVIIRPGTMLFADPRPEGAGITIEDDAMLGSGVHIYVANHRYEKSDVSIIEQGHSSSRGVFIGRGAWIGAGVIILPGVKIGRNSVIGAGSVVMNDVQDFTIAAGNPAIAIRRIG
jgi:acetyltransferase-like isoleucine patch superfamily enzyme